MPTTTACRSMPWPSRRNAPPATSPIRRRCCMPIPGCAMMGDLAHPLRIGQPRSMTSAVPPSPTSWRTHSGGRKTGTTVDASGKPLLRITETARFEKKHREIAAATWKRASIKSPANCTRLPHAGGGRRLQRTFDQHSQVSAPMNADMAQPVRVWDLPTRYSTGRWRPVSSSPSLPRNRRSCATSTSWPATAMAGLIAFRLLWGFVGGGHSRFADFLPTPTQGHRLRQVPAGR
jgi:hypothetical protein